MAGHTSTRRALLAGGASATALLSTGAEAQFADPLECADALLGRASFSKLFFDPATDRSPGQGFSVLSDDENVELMKKLFSKIALSTSVAENTGRPGDTFLVMENPGIFLDPNLNLADVKHARQLATLLDPIPNARWIYQPSARSSSDIYAMTLRDKELPLHALTPDQRRARQTAIDTVNLTRRAYFEKAEIFWDAHDEYWSALQDAQNRGQALNPRYEFRKNQAWNEWLTRGHKLRYENAVATVYNLDSLDPNRTWLELQQLLDQNRRLDGALPFYTTDVTPSYRTIVDMASTGWRKFVFGQKDWENQKYHSHVSAGGGGSAGWGLWRVSGGASYEEEKGFEKSFLSDIRLEMEMQRVRINREWMRSFIFSSRAWRWGRATMGSGSPISDGVAIGENTRPSGWMPLIPVALLVARKVKIEAKISRREYEYFKSRIEANASVGWGPFSVGGRYSRTEESSHEKGKLTENGIESNAPQIIGWFCDIPPLSPNPDPLLTWPNRRQLPDYDEKYMAKYKEFRPNREKTDIADSAGAYGKG